MYFKQGVFVLICAAMAVLIDQFVLESAVHAINSEWLPVQFAQVLLFPILLYISAAVWGPTDSVKISKVTHVTKRKRR